MLVRSLVIAAILALAPLGGGATPASAQAVTATMGVGDLMRATALDEVFTQFGATVEASADQHAAAPLTSAMRSAWTASAREAFAAATMHADLAAALENRFTPTEFAAFEAFFGSPFGKRVTEIERAVTILPPDRQLSIEGDGLALAAAAAPRRHEQIEEMLGLISADIALAMVRQSVRGVLIGMSMNGQQGDIQVPWEEIDAHIESIMPGIEEDVARTQRAVMFYAYEGLSEGELDAYLDFLRTDPARKFYALAAFSIGSIVADRMERFGETLARRLNRVGI